MQRVLPAIVLSEEVISLCRRLIYEHDPERLLELTLRINALLDPQEDGSPVENRWKAAVGAG